MENGMAIAADMIGRTAPAEIAASLFAISGKLAVALVALDERGAVAQVDAPPPEGSIAIVVRNHVRVFCTVAWVAGGRIGLAFDDPLRGWRMEDFAGAAVSVPIPVPA
jgi:hypothetical protein